MSSETTNTNDLEIIELNNKLEEKNKIIEDLKKEVEEERLISSKTKEYLFILENKHNIGSPQLLIYNTGRIDIKNIGTKNNTVKLIDNPDINSNITFPSWMETDKGKGMAIESINGNIYLKFKCINSGELNILLKGLFIKDKKEELFPIYIDYTSLTINGEEQLNESQLTWFGEPYIIKKEVDDGEIIELNVKWKPFSKDSFYKNTKVLKLENKNKTQKEEIIKIKSENKKLKNDYKELEKKYESILSSKSWRITKPLRSIKNK